MNGRTYEVFTLACQRTVDQYRLDWEGDEKAPGIAVAVTQDAYRQLVDVLLTLRLGRRHVDSTETTNRREDSVTVHSLRRTPGPLAWLPWWAQMYASMFGAPEAWWYYEERVPHTTTIVVHETTTEEVWYIDLDLPEMHGAILPQYARKGGRDATPEERDAALLLLGRGWDIKPPSFGPGDEFFGVGSERIVPWGKRTTRTRYPEVFDPSVTINPRDYDDRDY